MTDALKPCPFCGTQSVNDFDKWAVVRNIAHFVRCPECHSRTGNWGAHESALAAWNRRASPPDLEGVRESIIPLAEADDVKCVNAHDRCFGGASAPCPYCEPRALSSLPNSPGGVGEREAVVEECAKVVERYRGVCTISDGNGGLRSFTVDDIAARIRALVTAPTAEGKGDQQQ